MKTISSQATAKAQEDIKRILEVLNSVLEHQTFLVGESITLADISLSTALLQLYQQVCGNICSLKSFSQFEREGS